MFAQGRQSHVSLVDAVTLRHAQNQLKHLAVHWANQTASDGVRQAHGIPPMERTLEIQWRKVEICWQKKSIHSGIVHLFTHSEEAAWTSNIWIRPLLVRNVDYGPVTDQALLSLVVWSE